MASLTRFRLVALGLLLIASIAAAPQRVERPPTDGRTAAVAASPTVLAVSPTACALNVSPQAEIGVQFSQLMDHASFTAQGVRVVGERSGPYDATFAFLDPQEGTILTIYPTSPRAIGERVTVVLTSLLRSLTQEALAPYAWTFTTACQPGPISFAQDSTYYVARLPFEMSASDVNRDGYTDFQVAYTPSTAGTLGVFTNDADATLDFVPTTVARTGAGPRGIHSSDFDGDGYPDIAMTISIDSTFVVFRNDQSGGFPDTTKYKTSVLAYNISGADLDMDGDMDLVMGNLQGPQILLARNDGAGGFGNFATVVADSSPRGIEAFDVDGDGDLDLLAVNANGKVSVFRNLGGGTFGPDTTYQVGFRPLSLYVNDLNADGHPDIAVSNVQGGSVSLLFNLGDGRFGPASTIVVDSVNVGPGKNTLFEVYGNDFDGDGDIDLATADWFTGRYVILSNNGAGQYQTAVLSDSIGVGLQNIVGGDLDGDGDIDLVVSNWANGVIRIFRNGSSVPSVLYRDPVPNQVDGPLSGVMFASFSTALDPSTINESTVFITSNEHGRAVVEVLYDALQRTIHASPRVRFFPGEEVSGTFGPGISSVVGSPFTPSSWGFLVGTSPGSRRFVEAVRESLLSARAFLLPGAFDQGDLLDFAAVTREPGEVRLFLNAGGLDFLAGPVDNVGGRLVSAVSGDLDADGDPDVALADAIGGAIRVVLTADSALQEAPPLVLLGSPTALSVGDFNNDGWNDLLFGKTGPSLFGIWWNSATGFGPTTSLPLTAPPLDVAAFDKDSDGDLDVAVLVGPPAAVRIYKAIASGTFLFNGSYPLPASAPVSLRVGDLSGDGLPDLVVADGPSSSVFVLTASITGLFTVSGPLGAAPGCTAVGLADLDGDGLLDIASAGPGSPQARALYGEGGGSFGQDSVFSLSLLPGTLATGDFSNAGRQEILVGGASEAVAATLANGPATAVPAGPAALATRLYPARPNPANPLTEIRFDLAAPGTARLRIFNIGGELVRTLLDGSAAPGQHSVPWDGRDRSGRPVASGLYLYRLEAGAFAASGKVVILR